MNKDNIISKYLASVERVAGDDFKHAMWSASDDFESLSHNSEEAFLSIFNRAIEPMREYEDIIEESIMSGDGEYDAYARAYNKVDQALRDCASKLSPLFLELSEEIYSLSEKR